MSKQNWTPKGWHAIKIAIVINYNISNEWYQIATILQQCCSINGECAISSVLLLNVNLNCHLYIGLMMRGAETKEHAKLY